MHLKLVAKPLLVPRAKSISNTGPMYKSVYQFIHIDEVNSICIYVDTIRQTLYLCNLSCTSKEFNEWENVKFCRSNYKTTPDYSTYKSSQYVNTQIRLMKRQRCVLLLGLLFAAFGFLGSRNRAAATIYQILNS